MKRITVETIRELYCSKIKMTKGITLIALVITIIILLILAGITIMQLIGENSLMARAKEAKQKETEAEIRETVQLMLYEYQLEKVNNGELKLLEYLNRKKDEGKLDSVLDNNDGTIQVTTRGYSVKISESEQRIIELSNLEMDLIGTYEIKSYNGNTVKLLIKITNKNGKINTIKCPDGNILEFDGTKGTEEFYWDVIDGEKYDFIVATNGVNKVCTIQTQGMTKINSIEIKNLRDFKEFQTLVNAGYNFENKKISLKSDLDLSNICYKVDGTVENDISWTPIGSETNPFKGMFDGEGHTINNLYINKTEDEQGLFGYASDGKISDIIIKGKIDIPSGTILVKNYGAICAVCKDETIEKCINYVDINVDIDNYNSNNIGGIIGSSQSGYTKVSKCINYANVYGKQSVGGIVGAKALGTIEIQECCNFGIIKSAYCQVGGIIGGTFGNKSIISNCYNTGNIIAESNTPDEGGRVGGIIGIAISWNETETININNCYNIGEVSVVDNYGGIIGLNQCNSSFSNCYFENTCGKGTDTGIQSIDAATLKTYSNILGEFYTEDTNNINNGYPILKWQIE